MKKFFTLLSIAISLMLLASSCDSKDPIVDKGTLESATYQAATKSFTLTYSSGRTETVNAVIDNSVTPPTASATLKDGTVISVSDANTSGDAEITTTRQMDDYRYVNGWIYENMEIYYLWNDKLSKSPNYSLNPKKFFDSILYKYNKNTNPQGDRFSWIQEDYQELLNSLSGVASHEIGFEYIFIAANEERTQYYALVLYPRKGSDAHAKGITRGTFVTQVNGQNITPDNYRSVFGGTGTKTLSTAKWELNSENQYRLADTGTVSVQMHSNFAENPIYLDSVYTVGDKKIGYLAYNFFAPDKGDKSYSYDKQLMNTLGNIKAKGASEMVLDLRYNGGGSVSTAVALASALVQNRSTNNVLVTSQYNAIVHNALLKEEGKDYNKVYFIDKISTDKTTIDVPSLNLPKLYVLVTGWSASASELIINGLKPYMDVILIGETTYGKNVGSISLYEKNDAKNKWGMQPIVVRYANSLGNSDFTAGFAPNYEVDEFDELRLVKFGDSSDPLLGKALSLITGQTMTSRAATTRTPFRSSQVDKVKTLNMKDRGAFEMYDDIREDALRKLMKN